LSQLRQENSRKSVIRVAFKESPEARQLEQLPGVSGLNRLSPVEWELQAEDPDAVKKLLLQLALQNNWNIVSLQSENQSLEEIFRTLTNNPLSPTA
jgi:ABC-2 type transport system ATP-binding protein